MKTKPHPKHEFNWSWSNRKSFWAARAGDRVLIDHDTNVAKSLQGQKATIIQHAKHENGYGYVLVLKLDKNEKKVRVFGQFCTSLTKR